MGHIQCRFNILTLNNYCTTQKTKIEWIFSCSSVISTSTEHPTTASPQVYLSSALPSLSTSTISVNRQTNDESNQPHRLPHYFVGDKFFSQNSRWIQKCDEQILSSFIWLVYFGSETLAKLCLNVVAFNGIFGFLRNKKMSKARKFGHWPKQYNSLAKENLGKTLQNNGWIKYV